MSMSTTTQTFGAMPIEDTRAPKRTSSFFTTMFQRFVKAREAEAGRRVAQFLHSQSNPRLADLGFSSDQIAEIRATGRLPMSFFK